MVRTSPSIFRHSSLCWLRIVFAGLLLAAAVALPARIAAAPALRGPDVGEVTYYAPSKDGSSSLMLRVWNWRIYYGHVPECPECVDAIALREPRYIGHKVWLRHPGGEVIGPLMVVDCAEAKHRANLAKRGWIADISWELSQRWKMSGPLERVTIIYERPDHVDVRTPINRPTSCPMSGCGTSR